MKLLLKHLGGLGRYVLSLCCALGVASPSAKASQSIEAPIPSWCLAKKPVKLAGLQWKSAEFLTEFLHLVLEKGYACQTEILPGNTVAMEAALANNDIQIIAEAWVGRSPTWEKAILAGKIKAVGSVIQGATEGWFIPAYVKQGDVKRGIKPMAPMLQHVSQLPRYKALFKDEEDPTKGRFLNCPTGWTCEGVNSQKLKAYGLLNDYVNFHPGTGAAMEAEITSAYQRGKPIVFFHWSPSALMGKFEFIRLKEPPYRPDCFKTLATPDHKHPCASAAETPLIKVAVSKALFDSDPVLIHILEKFNVPLPWLNHLLAEQAQKKTATAIVCRDFLKQHPEVLERWVPPEIAKRILKSLSLHSARYSANSAEYS